MANKHLHVGVGGRNCNCCFPAPGSKDRRARYRIAKRKADRLAMREAEQDLIDHECEISEAEMIMEEMDYAQDDFYDDFYDEKEYRRELEREQELYAWDLSERDLEYYESEY